MTAPQRSIAAVSVGRSDVSIYRPVLDRLRRTAGIRVRLVATAAHLSPRFGLTVDDLREAGFGGELETVETPLDSDSPEGMARSMGAAVLALGQLWRADRPDVVLAVGDRFEMLAAVVSTLPFNIPVAHVHGGEVTEGAVDDAIRHAITKLSHLHFVATDEYRRRVLQLGEEEWRVVMSGAPSLDNLASVRVLDRTALEARLGRRLEPAPILVTYHPETRRQTATEAGVQALLAALARVERPIVFTLPNADPGGQGVAEAIARFVATHARASLVPSLGTEAYFGLMAISACMVGNSSSGILEAPSFRLPVVNIGDRQKGRVRAANVIDTPADPDRVAAAIARATSPEFGASLERLANPYGDGRAAARIVDVLATVPLDERLTVKRFVDREAST